MAMNFLEQLIAEWYEYQGYFVRRNILVGKRDAGGHDTELDIIAFHPEKKHLVHIEPSMDADSWATRNFRFQRKFDAGKEQIPIIFRGFDLPHEIEQIVVLVFASKLNHQEVGGGKLVLIGEILEKIFNHIKDKQLASSAIPEHLPTLRSFQFVNEYRDILMKVWNDPP